MQPTPYSNHLFQVEEPFFESILYKDLSKEHKYTLVYARNSFKVQVWHNAFWKINHIKSLEINREP